FLDYFFDFALDFGLALGADFVLAFGARLALGAALVAAASGAAAGSGTPSRFCWAMVLSRAMSRRTSRTREVFSSCPVARWKRRLNRSFLSFSTSSSIWSTVMART